MTDECPVVASRISEHDFYEKQFKDFPATRCIRLSTTAVAKTF